MIYLLSPRRAEGELSSGEKILSSVVGGARSKDIRRYLSLEAFNDLHVKTCGESLFGR